MSRWATSAVFAAAAVCTLVPFGAALIAWQRGWMPTGDWAAVTIRSHDTLAGEVPLVGIYSSATTTAGGTDALYHPGPLQEWLLAVPTHLFAPSTVGVLVGSAALVALCAVGVFGFAWRLGGTPALGTATVFMALFMLATGPGMLREPLHTPLATFAVAAFLVAAVAVLAGDDWGWPATVFFGSLATQAQVAFCVPVAAVAIVVVAGRIVAHRRARHAAGTPRGSPRRLVAIGATTAVVTLACWAAPLWDQFRGTGNLWALVHTGSSGDHVGASWTVAELVRALSIPPAWLFRGLHLSVEVRGGTEVVWHTAAWQWLSAGLVVVALVVVCWWVARHGSGMHRALGAVAVAALAGCVLATWMLPDEAFSILGHREIWRAPGALVWCFLTVSLVSLARGRLATRQGVEAPRPARRVGPVVAPLGVVAVVGVALFATIARSSPARDASSAAYGAVETLTAAADRHCGAGPVALEPATLRETPVALGVAAMLTLRDCRVHVATADPVLPGARHRVTGAEPTRLVLTDRGDPPPGCRGTASYDPTDPPARYRDFGGVLQGLQSGGRLDLFVCR